jgi:hypothetical protein
MNYAVTGKRLLILRSGPFSKFSAIKLDQLQDANLSERADGRITIRFGAVALGRPQVHSAFVLFPGLILTEGLNKL